MPTDEDFDELKATVAALKQELGTTKTKLRSLEDFAATHIGMDWGQAGISANVSHPNISADTIEYGGGVGRLTFEGGQLISEDSGDSVSESPNAALFKWFKDDFDGTPLAEVFGGYTTPGLNISQLILRALADNMDFGAISMGVWSESGATWNPRLQLSNTLTSANPPLVLGTAAVQWFAIRRTDDDNFTIWLRQGGVLTQISTGGILADTAWAAAGDLVYGTGNDTATILTHSGIAGQVLTSTTAPNAMTWATPAGGSFSYGKAITTSQGQNLP